MTKTSVEAAIAEKRREPRHPAQGAVWVHYSNPHSIEIQGELMDVSQSGFRMAHGFASLQTGQEVQFSHPTAMGTARAMWNRITGQRIETGFLILSRQ